MSADAYGPPNPELWQVQYLRLIAFPLAPAFEQSREWWRDMVNSPEANSTSTERRQRQEREETGRYDGADLSLAVDLLRVQWTASAIADAANPSAIGAISMGQFLEKRAWFSNLMTPWLANTAPPIKRLAIAGVLIQPAADRNAAYENLNRYLRHVDLDPNTSSEFLYRINRPITSTVVPGMTINRLAIWASVAFRHLRLVVSSRPEIQQQPQVGADVQASIVEFDFNTSADRQDELPRDRLANIFTELSEQVLGIARNGDSRP